MTKRKPDLLLSHPFTVQFVRQNAYKFTGKTLVDAFSTDAHQHFLAFQHAENEDDTLVLQMYLSPQKTFYQLKDNVAKPRSKYQSMYKSLLGKKVTQVSAFWQERSWALYFDSGHCLVFALFGRKNFMHLIENAVPDSKLAIKLHHKSIDMMPSNDFCLDQAFLQKVLKQETPFNGEAQKWLVVADPDEGVRVDLKSAEHEVLLSSKEVVNVLDVYARTYFHFYGVEGRRKRLLKQLHQQAQKWKKALQAAEKQADRLTSELDYKNWADLLMAYMHLVPTDAKKVELEDFTSGEPVSIPLKPKLKAQENAARYYRKAKNQDKELEMLLERQTQLTEKLEENHRRQQQVEAADSAKTLQHFEKEWFQTSERVEKESRFKSVEIQGFDVYIGRNAKNNDELTVGFAHKNDLWLHAKDLGGSHVLVRNKGSKTQYPKPVIEAAAALAAWHSKGRNQDPCPVIYTLKKYVRKPKGVPAGAVLLEREDVIFVSPREKP